MEKFRIKNLLLPTDFSDSNLSAFKTAVAICKRQQAKLTLLYVLDDSLPIYEENLNRLFPTEQGNYESMKKEISKLAVKLSGQTGIKVEGRLEKGTIGTKICSVAYEGKFDMIVVGTHGISGQSELFIGSNAFNVIKCAPCPVLTIPGQWDRQYFSKIIFPVRLISGTLEKYVYIQPIVEKNKSEIIIVGLADSNKPSSVGEMAVLVDHLELILHNANVSFTTKLVPTKDFSSKILENSEEFDADLIVISADIDFEYKEYMRGPFAQQIVNNSKCPVLSIRPELDSLMLKMKPKDSMTASLDKFLASLE
jgi:nucleotide-binding universal stress UspA family protein